MLAHDCGKFLSLPRSLSTGRSAFNGLHPANSGGFDGLAPLESLKTMAIAPSDDSETEQPSEGEARSIVLVGLMGAGKSCVGRKLAESLEIPFHDSDEEVEKAAGCEVKDIFKVYGEAAFRDCERRVIQRLLNEGPCIIATGGGAFMDPDTRAGVKANALSVWLRADPDVLHQRTKKSKSRPLLNNDDPLQTLKNLAEQRYPTYAEADVTVETGNESLESTISKVMDAIKSGKSKGTDG